MFKTRDDKDINYLKARETMVKTQAILEEIYHEEFLTNDEFRSISPVA